MYVVMCVCMYVCMPIILSVTMSTTLSGPSMTISVYAVLSLQLSSSIYIQLKDSEISKLRDEVEAAQDAKRFLTDEVNALKKSHGEAQDTSTDG